MTWINLGVNQRTWVLTAQLLILWGAEVSAAFKKLPTFVLIQLLVPLVRLRLWDIINTEKNGGTQKC